MFGYGVLRMLTRIKLCAQVPIALSVGLLLLSSPHLIGAAQAKRLITCSVKSGCSDWRQARQGREKITGRSHGRRLISLQTIDPDGNAVRRVIGHRPVGCPHAYCGCGLAHYLGLHDKRLWKAWNWARLFPRTSPHSGAAAVRYHHVMLLVRHIRGDRWLVRSYNGGRHLSWLYVRSVRGYVFVNPNASIRLASGK